MTLLVAAPVSLLAAAFFALVVLAALAATGFPGALPARWALSAVPRLRWVFTLVFAAGTGAALLLLSVGVGLGSLTLALAAVLLPAADAFLLTKLVLAGVALPRAASILVLLLH